MGERTVLVGGLFKSSAVEMLIFEKPEVWISRDWSTDGHLEIVTMESVFYSMGVDYII